MKSRTTARFRAAFRALPEHVRELARKAFRLFQGDPYHPSLRFRRIQGQRSLYSVRVSRDYRALAVREGDTVVWFWIGSHADYDALL